MEKQNILIVDDDLDFALSIKEFLEPEQYKVLHALNRKQGMEMIKAQAPDLIILDVMMDTWRDGFEMSRELKHDPRYKDIPILVLTGLKDVVGIDFQASAGDPQ
jgi:CheY-like chemotaxis protein